MMDVRESSLGLQGLSEPLLEDFSEPLLLDKPEDDTTGASLHPGAERGEQLLRNFLTMAACFSVLAINSPALLAGMPCT